MNYMEKLYNLQMSFQKKVEGLDQSVPLPMDDPKRFQYHIAAMQEELGEVLKADKRWKTHRNVTYNRYEKLDELADVFITTMNLSIWSGFSLEEFLEAVERKIQINNARVGNNIKLDK